MNGKSWFHVTVEYRTPGGNPGVWAGPVFSTWDECHEDAKKAARRAGRKMAKIDGGSASAYPANYDPTA